MQSVAAIAVSTVLGFLSGLGVGGGSLLMLWLTGPLGWPQAQARALNLLFFLPGASLATFLRRKRIPWKQLLPEALRGCSVRGAVWFWCPCCGGAMICPTRPFSRHPWQPFCPSVL